DFATSAATSGYFESDRRPLVVLASARGSVRRPLDRGDRLDPPAQPSRRRGDSPVRGRAGAPPALDALSPTALVDRVPEDLGRPGTPASSSGGASPGSHGSGAVGSSSSALSQREIASSSGSAVALVFGNTTAAIRSAAENIRPLR